MLGNYAISDRPVSGTPVVTVAPKAPMYCYRQGPELRFLKQHAIMWAFLGYDRYGQPVVDFPVQICTRWITKRREVLDPHGNTIALDAAVVVNRRIPMNSWIWKGTIEDWYNGPGADDTIYEMGTAPGAQAYYAYGSMAFDNELHEVKTYSETPNIKSRHAYKEVGVIRIPNAREVIGAARVRGLTGTFDEGAHP